MAVLKQNNNFRGQTMRLYNLFIAGIILVLVNGSAYPNGITVTSEILDKRQAGLRIYKPEKCFPGFTLFMPMPLYDLPLERYIYLIDMEGNVVHQWAIEYNALFARLTPDGYLLYIGDGMLQKLDPQGNQVWNYPYGADHDCQMLEDGNLLIHLSEGANNTIKESRKDLSSTRHRLEIVTPDKKVIWRWKSEEHIDELEDLFGSKLSLDPLWDHIGTCEMIQENQSGRKDPRFSKGNILISLSHFNVIAMIDYPSGKITWILEPEIISYGHTPTMLANGNLLILDNEGGPGWSRVIEVDPLTQRIIWEYHAQPKRRFFSKDRGNAQKLANGNIFVCEAFQNRLFEITPEGEIVWDYISTLGRTTGAYGIFRAFRYSPEYVKPLFERIEKQQAKEKENEYSQER